jgi:hypothetical protein
MIRTAWAAIAVFILLSPGSAGSQEPPVVRNSQENIAAAARIRLVEDLSVGKEEGGIGETLGRIFGVAVDSRGDIHVLDNGFVCVRTFDSTGTYVSTMGREGGGPGEFRFPTAITTDAADNAYVADRERVVIFDPDGQYLDQFRYHVSGFYPRSVKVNRAGEVFVSDFNEYDHNIIHKYSPDFEYVKSFCGSFALGQDVDPRIEQFAAGGYLDIDQHDVLHFTQLNPYEIRRFSPDGDLLGVIRRENDFMEPPEAELRADGGTFHAFPMATAVLAFDDGRILNTVIVPPESPETIVDLFDAGGKLIGTARLETALAAKCLDHAGRLYATVSADYPKVVRYRLSLEGPRPAAKGP